jgi:hypothetical protein
VSNTLTAALGKKVQRNIGQARDGGNDITVGTFRIECKRRKKLGTFEMWMQQAEDSCSLGDTPALVMRSDGGESFISFKLEDFLREFGAELVRGS